MKNTILAIAPGTRPAITAPGSTPATSARRNKLSLYLSDDECAAIGLLCRRFRWLNPTALVRHILRRHLLDSPCQVELAGFDPSGSLAGWVQECHDAADTGQPMPSRDTSLDLTLAGSRILHAPVNETKARGMLGRIFPYLRGLSTDAVAEVFDVLRESTREP